MGTRVGQPRIVTISGAGGRTGGGIQCCCCTCCTCMQLQFLGTVPGILKLAQVILAAICQSLLVNYGMQHAGSMGPAFNGFLTTASSCLMTTSILLASYVFSENSFRLVRSSLFETLFNCVASFLYFSASSYLGYAVNVFLWPEYLLKPYFQAYPAMTATYIFGTLLGFIHGYDAYLSFRQFKGYH